MTASASTATVSDNDHVTAAACLMRHNAAAVLAVLDAHQLLEPLGIITKTDIDQEIADGKNLNEARVWKLMTLSPGRHQPSNRP